jgi:hypothetical protein
MNFLQSSPHFTHHFLMRLLETPEWLREGLLSCNSDDIRTVSKVDVRRARLSMQFLVLVLQERHEQSFNLTTRFHVTSMAKGQDGF